MTDPDTSFDLDKQYTLTLRQIQELLAMTAEAAASPTLVDKPGFYTAVHTRLARFTSGPESIAILTECLDDIVANSSIFEPGTRATGHGALGMNAVKCHHCGAVILSLHRHDFVSCRCEDAAKRVCVDGGEAYMRRLAGTKASFTEIRSEAEYQAEMALAHPFDGEAP